MFDIGAMELFLVAVVALVIIGPKDLPIAMRTAGRWLGQLRAMTGHFRVGIDAMIREAEIEEQEKIWAEKNAQVMKDHPPEKTDDGKPEEGKPALKPASAEDPVMKPKAEDGDAQAKGQAPENGSETEPPVPDDDQLSLLPDEPDRKPGGPSS